MIFCVYSMNTTCLRSVYAYHGGLFWPHICLTFTLTWLMNVLWNVCLPVCPCLCQRAGVLLLPVGWCTPSTLSERSPACRKGLQRMEAEERESLDQYPVLAELKLLIVKSSLCLYPTLLSLHRLLQQELSHTLPVFEQLLGTFPQWVHQVCSVFMELHAEKEQLCETWDVKLMKEKKKRNAFYLYCFWSCTEY